MTTGGTRSRRIIATTIPPTNDYDSAIVRTVNPGNYTAVLAGKGRTTGVGVVEVYDLDLTADSRLANISTRGFVDHGDNVLIAGTIVLGNGTTNVFSARSVPRPGVANALQDPTLELHDGQGNIIASNDNWQDDPVQAAAIQATTIPPCDPREAAILFTSTRVPIQPLFEARTTRPASPWSTPTKSTDRTCDPFNRARNHRWRSSVLLFCGGR